MSASNVHHLVPAFAPAVLEAVRAHVDRDPKNEVGGILVGHRRAGDSPVVTASIEAVGAEGDVTSLTFTHDAWAAMLAELDARHPDAEIIGWYHSHPGHGIFLSEHDRFIHRNFFSAPWHVAFVVDPQQGKEGLFAWTSEGLQIVLGAENEGRARRLNVIEIDETPVEPAITVRPEDLAPNPEPTMAGVRTADESMVAPESATTPARRPEGLLLPILAGLLMGFIVGMAVQLAG